MKKQFILLAIASFFITYASSSSISLDSVWSKNINANVQQTLFSHDGQSIYVASIESNHQLLILDAATGDSIGEFKGIFNPKNIALTADGETLYAVCDSLLMGWNTHSGSVLKTMKPPRDTNYDETVTPLYYSMTVSGDGTFMAAEVVNKSPGGGAYLDWSLIIWDTNTWEIIQKIKLPKDIAYTKLKFSNNGEYLACGEGGMNLQPGGDIILYNTFDWTTYNQFHGNIYEIQDLDFSPNDSLLASTPGGTDSTILLWDISQKVISKVIRYDAAGYSVKFINKDLLIAGGMNPFDRQVIVWDLKTYDSVATCHNNIDLPFSISIFDNHINIANADFGIFELTLDTATSVNELIEEQNINNFLLYPNPANETLNIRSNNNGIHKVNIDIFDNLFSNVNVNYDNPLNNEEIVINISNLITGLYYCKIDTGKNVTFSKFIINK